MNEQALYLEDPLKLEFEAQITQLIDLPDGRSGVILDHTYFYPTGGGQWHDTGTIGGIKVVDVFKRDDEIEVIHVLEGLTSLRGSSSLVAYTPASTAGGAYGICSTIPPSTC
jgi:Ser-tRNA(Ala) deacylase AlaX